MRDRVSINELDDSLKEKILNSSNGYTKAEIDKMIHEIQISGGIDLSKYYTKDETKIEISTIVNNNIQAHDTNSSAHNDISSTISALQELFNGLYICTNLYNLEVTQDGQKEFDISDPTFNENKANAKILLINSCTITDFSISNNKVILNTEDGVSKSSVVILLTMTLSNTKVGD